MYDVIVVGLGAVGSALTVELARRGATVAGIDRFSPPHDYGSSHGAARVTRLANYEGPNHVQSARRSQELWRELEAETGDELLTLNGALSLVDLQAVPDGLDRIRAAAKQHRLSVEDLDAAAIRQRYPAFQVTDSTAAILDLSGGFVRPEPVIQQQLNLASKRGATLLRDERVLSVEATPTAASVHTGWGRLHADRVVITAGPWLGGLLNNPALGALFAVHRQVSPYFEVESPQQFAPDAFPTFLWRYAPRTDHLYDGFFYGFPTLDGLTIRVGTGSARSATTPGTITRQVEPSEPAQVHTERINGRLPGVSSRVSTAATCMYTVTPDAQFVIDTVPGQDRIWLASACSGHGFKHSAAIGEAIAQRLTDGTSDLDLSPFSLARFS